MYKQVKSLSHSPVQLAGAAADCSGVLNAVSLCVGIHGCHRGDGSWPQPGCAPGLGGGLVTVGPEGSED